MVKKSEIMIVGRSNHVDIVHECDRQTDRQTDRITMTKTAQRESRAVKTPWSLNLHSPHTPQVRPMPPIHWVDSLPWTFCIPMVNRERWVTTGVGYVHVDLKVVTLRPTSSHFRIVMREPVNLITEFTNRFLTDRNKIWTAFSLWRREKVKLQCAYTCLLLYFNWVIFFLLLRCYRISDMFNQFN